MSWGYKLGGPRRWQPCRRARQPDARIGGVDSYAGQLEGLTLQQGQVLESVDGRAMRTTPSRSAGGAGGRLCESIYAWAWWWVRLSVRETECAYGTDKMEGRRKRLEKEARRRRPPMTMTTPRVPGRSLCLSEETKVNKD